MGKKNDNLGKFAFIMLMASGADIIAPKELRRQAIEALGLEDSDEFTAVDKELQQVKNPEDQLNIIKALILTRLTPTQMISLHDTIHSGVTATVEYLSDHPEERGEAPSPKEAVKRIEIVFDSDSDE